jgi:hypothetical protein
MAIAGLIRGGAAEKTQAGGNRLRDPAAGSDNGQV